MYQRLIFSFCILQNTLISENLPPVDPFHPKHRDLTTDNQRNFAGFALLLVSLIVAFSSCDRNKRLEEQSADSLELKYTIQKTLPHDTKAFTEGLVMYDNKVLESTGLNSHSWIAEVNLSGEHDKKVVLSSQFFGEGITVLNGKIYQLTYREKTGFIYDADDYEKIGEFNYDTEGWGITHDGHHLIMSDGSHKLYFLDTTALRVIRTLPVSHPSSGKVKNLNELEFINGFIFANVHESSLIVKIDPSTGKVVGRLDLTALTNEIKRIYSEASELNGIAFDPDANTLLVTGKFWPKAYVIKIQ